MSTMTEIQQAFLSRVTDAAVADDRVFACWTEGDTPQGCFPPFAGAVDLHVGTIDPLFDALAADHATLLGAGGGRVVSHRDADAPLFSKVCEAELEGGVRVRLTLERMSLVPKRARAYVAPLVDKTQQLRFVLDYSKRAAAAAGSGHR